MTKEQMQQIKTMLLELRKEIVEQMNTIKERGRDGTIRESSGDNSGYSYHMADQGTDSMDCEQSFIQAERECRSLHDVDEALRKIEKGIYGQCELCEDDIIFERLEVLPYTTLCTKCQSNEEKMPRGSESVALGDFD